MNRSSFKRPWILILFLISIGSVFAEEYRTGKDSIHYQKWYMKAKELGVLGDYGQQYTLLDSLNQHLSELPSQTFQLKVMILRIENSLRTLDPDSTFALLSRASRISDGLRKNHPLQLQLEIRKTAIQLKQGVLSSDSALALYFNYLPEVKMTRRYALETELLGRIALIYRTKKILGEALQYNQEEIAAAIKSKDKMEIAKSKISELDILYELIPRPIQSSEIQPLIEKGETLLAFMNENSMEGIRPFVLLYLSKFYVHSQNYDKAKQVLEDISDSSQINIRFSKYEQLCEVAKTQNDLSAYHRYVLKFKPIAYQTQREFVLLNVHNYLLDYFMKVKNQDSASLYCQLLEGNLQKVDTSQYLSYLSISHSLLSGFYEELDFRKALTFQKKKNSIDQQIIQIQKQALTKVIDYKEETEGLKEQNSELNQGLSFIKSNFILLSILFLSLSVLFVLGIRKYRKSKVAIHVLEEEKTKIEEVVERKHILLNSKNKLYFDDIYFIKSEGNYVDFHLEKKSITDRNTLLLVLEKLPPNFVRCHRSYLVNKNFIQSTSSSFIKLSNGNELPVSRTYKSAIS